MNLDGVYTALITPFMGGEVDIEGMRENIHIQLNAGVRGILPLGTTGETPTLSRKECNKIISLAVEEAGKDSLVLVGTGSNSTEHTIENTRIAKDLGADIALIVTPYYNKPTQTGILSHFEAVVKEVDIPVIVYNIKGRTGTNIETSTMEKLSCLPNVIGVKEASGDIRQMGDVISRIQNKKSDFSVLSGDDALTIPLMSLGGRGVISVVANLVPDQMVKMVKAALAGNFVAARQKHFELLPLFEAAFYETNPIPIKAAMKLCGMAAGDCRLPLCSMNSDNKGKLKDVLRNMGLMDKVIKLCAQ